AKAAIDTRLEIDDPEFAYPVADRVFESECALTVGHQEVVLIPLPGHSNCCSVVWFPSISTLYSADYLVTPGLPYCRWEIGAFRQALDWLGAFCRRERVQRVWPSHYVGHTSPLAIQTAIAKDRTYLEVLEQACQTGLRRELKDAAVVEAAERAVLALGGHHDRAGRLQHHDNAKRMLACLKP
ncbi:MAG TPA: hypothetical protein P5218_12605, partial [Planctomycetota bacterium]|nr:hypothetical protein [Planctomycetota bacterium]